MSKYESLLEFSKFVRDNVGFYGINRPAGQVLEVLCSVSRKTADQPGINPFCYLSNKQIAERCNKMSGSAVQRALVSLEKANLICRVRKGNGKRFVRKRNGQDIPVGSYIDLQVLHERSMLRGEDEAGIRTRMLELAHRQDVASKERDHLIAWGDRLCDALSPPKKAELQKLQRVRLDRLKSAGLHAIEEAIENLSRELQEITDLDLAAEMTTTGAQNDHHKEPKFRSKSFGAGENCWKQEDISGFSLAELQEILAGAFNISSIDANNVESVCEYWFDYFRLKLEDIKSFGSQASHSNFLLLILLYIGDRQPNSPKQYLAELARRSQSGQFCIDQTLQSKRRANRHALKKIKDIKGSSSRHV